MNSSNINRRQFLNRAGLAGLGILALGGGAWSCEREEEKGAIPGKLLGPDFGSGHRLRMAMGELNERRIIRKEVVIIGGGVAGLACAWRLRKMGIHDFTILEMEYEPGGNARGGITDTNHWGLGRGKSADGKQAGQRYPWGAHYLPVPDARNTLLIEFLQSAGVVTGFDLLNRPVFNELYLCQAPEERLMIHGQWQKGLVPQLGVPAKERAQIAEFFQVMEDWKKRVGVDGKPAFAIPAENSSQDPEFLHLDTMTMAEYLHMLRLDSPHLRWYVDYCCRDDFGLGVEQCSAWAGVHYFASRTGGGANAESSEVLTWPEGNAWLVQQLSKDLDPWQLQRNSMAYSVKNMEDYVEVKAIDPTVPFDAMVLQAKAAVFAGPQFVAAHIVEGHPGMHPAFTYAPWIVANVRLRFKDNPLLHDVHWDNVPYGRKSLGYVHAGHQSLAMQQPEETVLTWYMPLSDGDPKAARKQALDQRYAHWQAMVMEDLEYMHPGLVQHVRNIDVWTWGHGMIRPLPGLITGEALRAARQPIGRIHFAHSDLSGMSIFEEAFHQGCRAAAEVAVELRG
ncbi:MAG: NAD(P)-binding protein [Bacteroidia bacterium]